MFRPLLGRYQRFRTSYEGKCIKVILHKMRAFGFNFCDSQSTFFLNTKTPMQKQQM
jgi:hypothetical protein